MWPRPPTIDALIAGKILGTPKQGTGKNGSPYTTAAIQATAGNGEGMICNVIAFRESARAALDAMGDGDSVAASGALTPKVWTNREGQTRQGLDLVCHAVLTSYHVNRKRRAMVLSTDDDLDADL